jgi:hypothetical protein
MKRGPMMIRTIITVISMALIQISVVSCGGQFEYSRVFELIPANDYKCMVGVRPDEISKSRFIETLVKKSRVNPEISTYYTNATSLFRTIAGMDFKDIKYFSVFISDRPGRELILMDSTITIDMLKSKKAESGGPKMTEREAGERDFLALANLNAAFVQLDKGILVANDIGDMKQALGSNDKLAGDEAFKKAMRLCDSRATYFMFTWDKRLRCAEELVPLFGGAISGDRYDQSLAQEAEERAAGFGISVYMADELTIKLKVGFGDEGFATRYADYLKTNKRELAYYARHFVETRVDLSSIGAFEALSKLLVERIRITSAGSVVEISFNFKIKDIDFLSIK